MKKLPPKTIYLSTTHSKSVKDADKNDYKFELNGKTGVKNRLIRF